jgi:hypothetical protein
VLAQRYTSSWENEWLALAVVVYHGALVVGSVMACLSAFSLAATYGLRGLRLWRTALGVVVAKPSMSLGLIPLLGGLMVLAEVAPVVVLATWAPMALYGSTLTRSVLGPVPAPNAPRSAPIGARDGNDGNDRTGAEHAAVADRVG